MCGRYALALPPSAIVRRLIDNGMLITESPEDEDTRETYNFAPGYYGLVYRADTPDYGAGHRSQQQDREENFESEDNFTHQQTHQNITPTKYKLQAMKWGLIPFWTKRNPDYGSLMRTINCRDDSLAQKGGMWQTMKQRKRCIVIAQGFYEWLKKNDGKEKIPHFIKRKDGNLMCMAGLWDCVKYEDAPDKLYSYTIITTDNNKQMAFLHDRMPVILEAGSEEMFAWLDPGKSEWSGELQSLLQPYKGELEIYPVSKEVGKVGNNSPNFIIPIDSKDNKNNIANFFSSQKKATTPAKGEPGVAVKDEEITTPTGLEANPGATLTTNTDDEVHQKSSNPANALKKKRNDSDEDLLNAQSPAKARKIEPFSQTRSPIKAEPRTPERKMKPKASPVKESPGNSKITSFFSK